MPQEELVGTITQYDDSRGVALVSLSDMLSVGDQISVKGPHSGFFQEVAELKVAHQDVRVAYQGDLAEIRTLSPVEPEDKVFAET